MTRSLLLVLIACCLAGVLGCGQASSDAVAASKNHESVLALLPGNAAGVFFLDVQKVWSIPAAKARMTTDEKLHEFLATTGIDLSKDVRGLAGAVTSRGGEAVFVLDAKLDRDVLIGKIKEQKGLSVTEEPYEGVTIYETLSDNGSEETRFLAFLDGATVTLGTSEDVRAVIDVYQKRSDSMLKNANLMGTIAKANHDAILWAAFAFDQGDVESITDGNPMLGQLGGLQSMVMGVDYREQNILLEIDCTSGDAEQNQQVFDMLNGLKSFAAMGAAENPEMAAMLRGIEISSGPESVSISATIPEALLQKMDEEREGD